MVCMFECLSTKRTFKASSFDPYTVLDDQILHEAIELLQYLYYASHNLQLWVDLIVKSEPIGGLKINELIAQNCWIFRFVWLATIGVQYYKLSVALRDMDYKCSHK